MIGAHVYAARINTDNRLDRYVDLGRRFRPGSLGSKTNKVVVNISTPLLQHHNFCLTMLAL